MTVFYESNVSKLHRTTRNNFENRINIFRISLLFTRETLKVRHHYKIMATALESIFSVPYTYPLSSEMQIPILVKGKQYTYYTPLDVALHCHPADCWVSWHGNVYNITPVIEKYKSTLFIIMR